MPHDAIYIDDELFLGRLDEQDKFRETLHKVLAPGSPADAPHPPAGLAEMRHLLEEALAK